MAKGNVEKMKRVKITQVKSQIGYNARQKATLNGLGLRRIGHSRVHDLTPQIQGMISKIEFLLRVEEESK